MKNNKKPAGSILERLKKSIQTFGSLSLNIECRDKLYRYNDALMQSLYSILEDQECSADEKMQVLDESLSQYTSAMKELFPKLIGNGCEVREVVKSEDETPKNDNPISKSDPDRFDTLQEVTKFNINHDPKTGRFCSGSTVGGVSNRTIANGGISVHIKNGKEPKDGYMCAVYTDRSTWLKGDEVKDPAKRESAIQSFMDKNKDVLSDPDNYLGTWFDTETGNISLDISRNFKDKAKAIEFASANNEKAIWDVANMAEISTGGTGNNID